MVLQSSLHETTLVSNKEQAERYDITIKELTGMTGDELRCLFDEKETDVAEERETIDSERERPLDREGEIPHEKISDMALAIECRNERISELIGHLGGQIHQEEELSIIREMSGGVEFCSNAILTFGLDDEDIGTIEEDLGEIHRQVHNLVESYKNAKTLNREFFEDTISTLEKRNNLISGIKLGAS